MAKNEITIASKFQPLFELLKGQHPEIDTVVLTGGRGSSKSFTVAIFSLMGVVTKSWKILYSRFTNQSIGDSIKQEVTDKIDLLGFTGHITDNQRKLHCPESNGYISFKGIKTGAKIQTANLKSLTGFNVFIVDEAEEIPNEDTFKKVFYSIRSNDKQNISILILNPTTKDHWIYKAFFKRRGIKSGFCGKKDNVMYIHSSYKDVAPGIIPQNIIDDYERLKKEDPKKYHNIVEGGWIDQPEGAVFELDRLKRYDGSKFNHTAEDVDAITAFIDTADEGEDSLCMVVGINIGEKIFIQDVVFTTESTEITPQLCAEMINKYDPAFVRIESNMGGGMFRGLMKPYVKESVQLLTARAKANKMKRIITLAGFVKEFCYFRDDYAPDSEYDKFMIELVGYTKDGESEHDDAPDGLTGCAAFIRRQFGFLYPSTYLREEDGYSTKGE